MKTVAAAAFPLLALCALMVARANEPVSFAQGSKLMTRYHCQSCHAVDETLSGPSFHDIAVKYASDPHAPIALQERILNGASGAWGPNPMPPVKVPETDLEPLVEWLLSLRQF
jgi:cytochrome c